MILGRRDSTSAAGTGAAPVNEPAPGGKGRPTPKRSEARKARRDTTPRNRKDQTAQQRERTREARMRARQALLTGDERYLPARDAGPERRLARDVVDSHFTLGQVFLLVIAVAFVTSLIPNRVVQNVSSLASLGALTVIVVDSARQGRRAKVAISERFGVAQARGISSYAFLRAMLPRRFRRPPPKVARGGAAL